MNQENSSQPKKIVGYPAAATISTTSRCKVCGTIWPADTPCPDCTARLFDIALDAEAEESGEWSDAYASVELSGQRFQHFEVERAADGSLRELGRGAMGITYKAFDTNLHAPVALKIINSQLTDDPKARERFLREARAAARLRHPNVATVLHLGQDAESCFYAMEFIEGETLEAFVSRQGPLPVGLALEIAAQASRALGAAQSEGLVHRDIKPANIMLARHKGEEEDEDQRSLHVKVIDFGLAKLDTETVRERFGWMSEYFAGTPYFASPEQLRGEAVDGRSDIYSLGATLRYMLTGAAFFAEAAAAVIGEEPRTPPPRMDGANFPRCVQALLATALAADPAQRPQNAAEFLALIEECQEEIALPPRGWVRRWAGALLVLMCALAAGGAVAAFSWRAQLFAPPLPVLAVAAFSGAERSDDQALSNHASDDLAAALGKNDALKVARLSPQASKQYDQWPADNAITAPTAKWLLRGRIERTEDVLKVSVRLFDVQTQTPVWGESYEYDGHSADFANIESNVVRNVLKPLRGTYLPKGSAPVGASDAPELPQAAENYRLGREQSRKMTLEGLAQALVFYKRALELAPKSARINAALAEMYCQQVVRYSFPAKQMDTAMQYANKAVELAPDDPSGYNSLALLYSTQGQNWKALEQCREAIEIAPGSAAATNGFGILWLMLGKPENGLPWVLATTRLTPYNTVCWHSLGEVYKDLNDLPAAEACFRKVLATDSLRVEAHGSIAHILLYRGQFAEARQECAGARLMQPDHKLGLALSALVELYDGNYAQAESYYRRLAQIDREGDVIFYGGVRYLSALGFLRLQAGDETEGKALLREAAELDEKHVAVEFQSAFDLAAIRATEGRTEEALALLERTVKGGWVDFYAFEMDPRFRPLAKDPRFVALTKGLKEKIARSREKALAAAAKPLRLADYPVTPPPEAQSSLGK